MQSWQRGAGEYIGYRGLLGCRMVGKLYKDTLPVQRGMLKSLGFRNMLGRLIVVGGVGFGV